MPSSNPNLSNLPIRNVLCSSCSVMFNVGTQSNLGTSNGCHVSSPVQGATAQVPNQTMASQGFSGCVSSTGRVAIVTLLLDGTLLTNCMGVWEFWASRSEASRLNSSRPVPHIKWKCSALLGSYLHQRTQLGFASSLQEASTHCMICKWSPTQKLMRLKMASVKWQYDESFTSDGWPNAVSATRSC